LTPRQEGQVVKRYSGLIRRKTNAYRPLLSAEDFEELQADALMAVFNAIADYDANHESGASEETFVSRYIWAEAYKFVRNKATGQARFEAEKISLDAPMSPTGERHDSLLSRIPDIDYSDPDSAIALDLILRDIQSERDRTILAGLTKTRRECDVADDLGLTRAQVSYFKLAAIGKIQQKIKKRDWGKW